MTPERIQAFLDDLALLSVKHGIVLEEGAEGVKVLPLHPDFGGYETSCRYLGSFAAGLDADRWRPDALQCDASSLDVTKISAHQRLTLEASLADLRPGETT